MHMDNNKLHKLSYIAGFFDGEGTICIVEGKRKDGHIPFLSIKVCITNTSLDILLFIKDALSKHGIVSHIYHIPAHSNCVDAHNLMIQKIEDVLRFCKIMKPFVVIKSKHLDVAVGFCTVHLRPIRELCCREMRALNKRGRLEE